MEWLVWAEYLQINGFVLLNSGARDCCDIGHMRLHRAIDAGARL
jgi:hypothetical protein